MVDTTAVDSPDDLTSEVAAADVLEVDVGSSEDDIKEAYQDAVLETHPDMGGNDEDFIIVNRSRDILIGEREPEGGGAGATGSTGTRPTDRGTSTGGSGSAGASDAGTASGPGFGGFGANTSGRQQGPDREVIYNAMRNLLRAETDEATLKQKYGPEATMENVAEILTEMILAGGMTLGDVKKMLDVGGAFGSNLGEATGGLFGGDSASGGIFGGGGGLGSSDPADYMSYGAGQAGSDDDDDE